MLAGGVNIGALPNEQGIGRGDAHRAYLKVIGEALPEPPPPPPPSETPGCLAALFGQRK
jgi:hypothetical protein